MRLTRDCSMRPRDITGGQRQRGARPWAIPGKLHSSPPLLLSLCMNGSIRAHPVQREGFQVRSIGCGRPQPLPERGQLLTTGGRPLLGSGRRNTTSPRRSEIGSRVARPFGFAASAAPAAVPSCSCRRTNGVCSGGVGRAWRVVGLRGLRPRALVARLPAYWMAPAGPVQSRRTDSWERDRQGWRGLAGTARRPHAVRAMPSPEQAVCDSRMGCVWYASSVALFKLVTNLSPVLPRVPSSAVQGRRIGHHVFWLPASRAVVGGQVTTPSDRPKENPIIMSNQPCHFSPRPPGWTEPVFGHGRRRRRMGC